MGAAPRLRGAASLFSAGWKPAYHSASRVLHRADVEAVAAALAGGAVIEAIIISRHGINAFALVGGERRCPVVVVAAGAAGC